MCVSIVSRDGKLLLTKRASDLRAFPNAWVQPGGHLDPNESLEECGVREVFEETGIEIPQAQALEPYYIFESASGRFDEKNP